MLRIISIVGIAVVSVVALAGCGIGSPPATPIGTVSPAPTATAVAVPTALAGPTVVLSAEATPSVVGPEVPTAVATARADELTSADAQQVVRAYYDAMGREDYNTMLGLTTGPAQDVTKGFIDQVRSVEQQYGVTANLEVSNLTLGVTERTNGAWVVHTEATVATSGRAAFFTVSGPTYDVTAAFKVELVNSLPMITQLEQQMAQQ